MAFNPFESFRKNGKIIFAILTIVCMLTFVLSSGLSQGADFFDWLPKFIGGRSQKGEKIVEVYGTTQRAADLESLATQRGLANTYMLFAENKARQANLARVDNAIKGKELSEEVARELQNAQRSYQMLAGNPQFASNPQIVNALLGQSVSTLSNTLAGIDKTKRGRDYDAVSSMLDSLDGFVTAVSRRSAQYFNTIPFSSKEANAEFVLMLQRADKMGIVMTPAVVGKAISEEFGNALDEKGWVEVQRDLRSNFKDFTKESLMLAVANEFRVRAVMMATYGEDRRRSPRTSEPFYMTPFEFAQYFKDVQTRFNLGLIEIPVETFVAKVKETPTAEELAALFAKYNKADANPAVETPGFRDSRKIRMEWLSPSMNVALYAKAVPVLEAASAIASGFAPTSAGTGFPVGLGIQVVAPTLAKEFAWTSIRTIDFRLQDQNDPPAWSSLFEFAAKKDTTQSPPAPIGVATREAVLYDPATVASLLGHLIGGPSPLRDLSAQGAYRHAVETIEVRDRVRAGIPRLLGMASPYAGGLLRLVPSIAAMPKPLPLEFFKKESAKEIRNIAMSNIVAKDMEAFGKKVVELAKDKDGAAAAKKYIDDFLIARPEFKHGAMKTPRDIFTLGDDEAMKAMKDTQTVLPGDPSPWGAFFDLDPKGQPTAARGPKGATLFQPTWFPNGIAPNFDTEKPLFLTWRIEDIAAKQYSTYANASQEAKDKVIYAWKFEKARELAKAEAEALEASVKAAAAKFTTADDFKIRFMPQVRDLAGTKYRTVEPDVISLLTFSSKPDQQGQMQPGWAPYDFRTTDILYSNDAMKRGLLNLRKEKLGSTAVVTDTPKRMYYVATMFAKVEPETPSVLREFTRGGSGMMGGTSMYNTYARGDTRLVAEPEARKRVHDAAGFKLNEEYLKKEFEDRQNRE